MDRDVDNRGNDIVENNDARAVAGVNFMLGLWLIPAPWVLNYITTAQKWNSLIFGLAIMLFSSVRYTLPAMTWASWINGAIGLWLIISPWVINTVSSSAYWNDVIVGVLVAVLAFSNLQYFGRHHHTAV
jgi:hypothetical protein